MAESSFLEELSPSFQAVLESLPDHVQDHLVGCIKYLRAHPEPDGLKIFDIPIYPAMFRSMKCDGYLITFRVQDRRVLLHALVEDS